MTREEIDHALAKLLGEQREHFADGGEASYVVLARIVADQEARLRGLEPCPPSAEDLADLEKARAARPGRHVVFAARPHQWRSDGTCEACGTPNTERLRKEQTR